MHTYEKVMHQQHEGGCYERLKAYEFSSYSANAC